ncbi:SDR family oxidoreductase [Dactylosporangium darangshiense]|uniref:SDR family oxidoreductase n=1 Tax=Dactylosporangium darangshiense TaxID=579108 RepID=UPI003626CF3F
MILVVGATAFFGRQAVETLAARGVAVRALTRNPDAAGLPAGVDVVKADLTEPESLDPALEGVTAVLLVLPFGMDAGALLERARGRKIVVLSSGAIEDDEAGQPDVIAAYHHDLERAVAEVTPQWTALRSCSRRSTRCRSATRWRTATWCGCRTRVRAAPRCTSLTWRRRRPRC